MSRALWLPDMLREFALEPVEVDGWRGRGSDVFNPRGSVDHHTAGAASGFMPSLRILINGRSDLPGPLCNVGQPRAADGDARVHVVASGRANHAGKGGWMGLVGNSSVLGLERENVGTAAEPWTPWRFEVAARVHAAFAKGAGYDPSFVCEHKEWAPGRKPDAHSVLGGDMRRRVAELLASGGVPLVPGPPTQPQPDDDLGARVANNPVVKRGDRGHHVGILQALLMWHARDLTGVDAGRFDDGIFGEGTERVLKEWQRRTGVLKATGVADASTWRWLCGA